MPNPQHLTSYPALAGAILCLSALRSGARVQATLWSGKDEFTSTDGFVRDQESVLGVLTGYFGDGTAFPIHVLRETYATRKPGARAAHILVISDDGVSTMLDSDERGNSGWQIAAKALAEAAGGGTLVLNLPDNWEAHAGPYADIRRARDELGWYVHRVASLEELVEFARQFSRLRYGPATRPVA
jgi:nucleoside-diphosphate-sugar epimerase